MVTEVARLEVIAGKEADFESAFDAFKPFLAVADGFHGAQLQRSVERPGEYWLFVDWDTVQSHTVAFKEAGGFARWDELVLPYLSVPPDAVHAELRASVAPEA